MKIGISLTSSLQVGEEYIELTRRIADQLAKQGHGIVYGGTAYGMMLELAQAYKHAGGKQLVGVLAKDLMAVTKSYEAFENLDEKRVVDTMDERKNTIFNLSDAMLILPGGYGTLEEFMSIVGEKVNKIIDKPIVLYNYKNFYSTFVVFFDEMQERGFSKIKLADVVFINDNLDDIIQYMVNYKSTELADKFV